MNKVETKYKTYSIRSTKINCDRHKVELIFNDCGRIIIERSMLTTYIKQTDAIKLKQLMDEHKSHHHIYFCQTCGNELNDPTKELENHE